MAKTDKSLMVSVLLVCIVVAVGVAAYVKLAPADTVPRETKTEQQTGGDKVHAFTPYYKNDDLAFRSEPMDVPKNADKYVFVIDKYLRSVKAVPQDAVLKTCKLENGVATLDFNKAFDRTYGTFDESTIINGILTVMGQFSEVSYVKFTVEGQKIDTLGNMDLTDPLEVERSPGVPASGGEGSVSKP